MYLMEIGYKDESFIPMALERIALQILMSLYILLLYQSQK
jgi:hypothetical protein